ncbi:hypothetical protein [Paenibacillus hexagrammi]|uniref:ABC transporter permease n=1 Tax=Paenibacillus hexagrammi TaxID=2908839 RepID=A0ABY3SIR9_9BACL|nr:hypothetical protein [Paenibacillus sp. YPD9-1]UJF33893.1 hypothetical protein L0M14_01130 [Paenibacillus sp. YPD9-1]
MNHYGKLLHWEINRFAKIWGALALLTLLVQSVGVTIFSAGYMSRVKDNMYMNSIATFEEYISRSGKIDFMEYGRSLWFSGPIALCVAALLLYSFLIWYREWFGKNTFAYRLLMLPTSRMKVYTSKLTAIILYVLGLVALQIVILPLLMFIYSSIVPAVLRDSITLSEFIHRQEYLSLMIPNYFMEFILGYGAGITAVIIIFTAILLERSYRLKGIVAGILYIAAASILFVLPLIITESFYTNYFYPSEVVLMEIGCGLIILCVSLWFSSFLIRKKVNV